MMDGVDLYRPPWGVSETSLLAAVLVGLAVLMYLRRRSPADRFDPLPRWRRGLLLMLRLSALSALIWWLAGPTTWRSFEQRVQPLPVLILADTSGSMAEKDVPAGMIEGNDPSRGTENLSRFAAIRETYLAEDYLPQLQPRAAVRVLAFDSTLRTWPIQATANPAYLPDGKATHLFAALMQAMETATSAGTEGMPGAGAVPGVMVVLSDGHDTRMFDDPAVTEHLRQKGWRVFTVPVGTPAAAPDLALSAWAQADVVFPGQSTVVEAVVSYAPGGQGARPLAGLERPVRVELWHEGRMLDAAEVDFRRGGAQRVRFIVKPEALPTAESSVRGYEVRVAPITGEQVTENNQRWVFIHVPRQRIRIALFEGQPYWDTRFLAQTLAADAQTELWTYYALTPERLLLLKSGHVDSDRMDAATGGAEVSERELAAEHLAKFDLIVLGRGLERFFPGPQAAKLVNYVQQGGTLVLARGQPYTPNNAANQTALELLDAVTPVSWGTATVASLRLQVTGAGRESPLLNFDELGGIDAVMTRLPDMIAATHIQNQRAAAIIYLEQTPGGTVAGETTGRIAAVAYQHVGRGQVFAVLSEGMWRWAFLPSRLKEYRSVYQLFWSRAIRWLATGGEFLPGQAAALSLDRYLAEPDTPVNVTIHTRYLQPGGLRATLRVTGPDGKVEVLPIHSESPQATRYQALLRPTRPGVYTLSLTAEDDAFKPVETRLAVYDQALERLDTSARPEVLCKLAEQTGGECLGLHQRERLRTQLTALHEARQVDRKPEWAFDRWPVLALLGTCLTLEWFMRRRWGLA